MISNNNTARDACTARNAPPTKSSARNWAKRRPSTRAKPQIITKAGTQGPTLFEAGVELPSQSDPGK
jgi:hypothetical protein